MSIISKFPVIRNIEAIGLQTVRPLLFVTKDRLKETCINIPWVKDPSNQSMDHKRNVIRFSLDKFNKRYHVEGKEEYEPLTTEGLSRFMSHMEYHKNCVNSKVNEIINHSRVKFDKNNGICTLNLPDSIPSFHWILQKHLATRIISKIITFVKCLEQPPRLESVLRFYDHILSFSTLSSKTSQILLSHNKTSRYNNITLNNVLLCYEKKVNHENKKETLKDNNNSIPLQPQYYIRRLCNKDIYDIIEMKMEAIHATYKDIIERYKKSVPPIARFSIPVVIEKSYIVFSDNILRESEKIINIPTLGISLNPESISCWAKFRGNTLIGIDELIENSFIT
ncbi:hypothetical protein RirG_191880 [Rhizophagus irregularis DAOM 197198w]|uniref:tRNA(Ile)-lysidine/2-thiocytidine synthase N-terminal domain-containing protein n=1 Tax=Rhizophagus irregularis (strain DAOM 197198w) TaxID=1432141 RepID=A0A015IXM9_RHIIW|nr:hypothetical protein RirG_191880 [Rhizophagus irregularis DAOM 197198w]